MLLVQAVYLWVKLLHVFGPRQLNKFSCLPHLALATHMKAIWVNNLQVVQKTLKLKTSTCP